MNTLEMEQKKQARLESMETMEIKMQIDNHKWLLGKLYQDTENVRAKLRDLEIELMSRGA